MYNYNHLYYFYITAKSGSVTSAARHLSISQPCLTSQIKVLERQLDIKLFKKVGRLNKLTKNGTLVFGFCKRMFEVSNEMSEIILNGLPSSTRRIHLGVSNEIDRSFAVEVISNFLKKYTDELRPLISIVSGTQHELAEKLKFRELDLLLSESPLGDSNFMNLARAESPVILACSTKTENKAQNDYTKEFSLSALQASNKPHWLIPNSLKFRSEIDHFFVENKIKGRIVFESDIISSLVRSAEDSMGLVLLPLLYLKDSIEKGNIRILGPQSGYWTYHLWLIGENSSVDDPLIRSLTQSFVAEAGTAPLLEKGQAAWHPSQSPIS